MRLADFICAGAQKSGTTWLYAQLSGHPGVFMPTKELNFFYRDLPLYVESVVGQNPEPGDISAEDAAEVGAYCAPFDRQLRSLLGREALPW